MIKEVEYEPYRNKGMYPVSMDYEDGAFIVMLRADTVDFATLRVSVDGENTYEVIDSFTYGEE